MPHTIHSSVTRSGYASLPARPARNISARSVACPECGAEVGSPCVTASGRVASPQHRSRRRIAMRDMDLSYNLADLDYAKSLTPAGRRKARKALGLTQQEMASRIGAGYRTLCAWELGDRLPAGPEGAAYGAVLRSAA